MTDIPLVLMLTVFAASLITGGLGYGFSSIVVPIALLTVANRILNPAIVAIELPLNLFAVWVNRRGIRAAAPHIRPMLIGLVPGVAVGALTLASLAHDTLKVVTLGLLLPLVLLQTAGVRRPIRDVSRLGLGFGAGIGLLYAATTISGPPLALVLNNQGLKKDEFRAALAIIRTVEAGLTALAYLWLGLFSRESLALSATFLPAVLLGVPLGTVVLRRLDAETFRRICMAADGVLISFSLARALVQQGSLLPQIAYAALAAVAILEAVLLGRFLRVRRFSSAAVPSPSPVVAVVAVSTQALRNPRADPHRASP